MELNILEQTSEMLNDMQTSHLDFMARYYNFFYVDTYDPTVMLDETTSEFCRIVLNCYSIINNHYKRDAYLRLSGSTVPNDVYIYKSITRDGCPSIRPSVNYLTGFRATTVLNFVKNNHNEYFVVNLRDFLRIACFIFLHLEGTRTRHPELTFLFEECMIYQQNPRIPLSFRTLEWPLRRYFTCDSTGAEDEYHPHHFSYNTLMYLAVFVINEVVKNRPPHTLCQTTLDLQCSNTVVESVDAFASSYDIDIIAENLAVGTTIPPHQFKNFMVEVANYAMSMRFRYRLFSNDSVIFVHYDSESVNPGMIRVYVRNLFHWVLFRNLCNAGKAFLPCLTISIYNDYFVMDETTLKILHLLSVTLCSSMRTRWFSGIMPLYPLIARAWIDATTPAEPTEKDAALAWCAALAWLSIIFGRQNNFKTMLKPPAGILAMLRSPEPLCLANFFPLPNMHLTLQTKKSSYCHSQVRTQPLYGENWSHRFIDFLFSIDTKTCTACAELAPKRPCAERIRCGVPPTFWDFVVYIASNQEQGSPINPMPTSRNTIMMLLPNKMSKNASRRNTNFCNVFANALYPFLARFEILPDSWNFSF